MGDNGYKPRPTLGKISDQKYVCEYCHFITCKKSTYYTHISSDKHNMVTNGYDMGQNGTDPNQKPDQTLTCLCGKKYKHRQGLHTHKKKCTKTPCEDSHIIDLMKQLIEKTPANEVILELMKQNKELMQKNTPTANNDELVAELLKQNNEFKELMLEQSKYCLLYTSPSPRDRQKSRMPSSA